jgi:chemotaxis protein CheD
LTSRQSSAVLLAVALGSCLAIVLYDPARKNGAMAHVMLPGKAPAKAGPGERMKYAAIDALIEIMANMGSEKDDFCVAIIGGANVLKRENDTIA